MTSTSRLMSHLIWLKSLFQSSYKDQQVQQIQFYSPQPHPQIVSNHFLILGQIQGRKIVTTMEQNQQRHCRDPALSPEHGMVITTQRSVCV